MGKTYQNRPTALKLKNIIIKKGSWIHKNTVVIKYLLQQARNDVIIRKSQPNNTENAWLENYNQYPYNCPQEGIIQLKHCSP